MTPALLWRGVNPPKRFSCTNSDLRGSEGLPLFQLFLDSSCMTLVYIWNTRTSGMYLMKEPLMLKNYKIPLSRPVHLRNMLFCLSPLLQLFLGALPLMSALWLGGCVLKESGIRLAQIFWLIVVHAKFSKHVSSLISPLKQGQGVHSFCTHVWPGRMFLS